MWGAAGKAAVVAAARDSAEAGQRAAHRGASAWLHVLHEGGGTLDLCWCPSGNRALPADIRDGGSDVWAPSPPALPSTGATARLGLLAAACADGDIRLFAIPTPQAHAS